MSKLGLRVLLVEDSDEDAELVMRELRRGFDVVQFERVQTAEAMGAALDSKVWDLVVSDYSLPRFSGPDAHGVVRARGIDVPFIVVSGTIGEDAAVSMMKLGVSDYLVKGKLARLVPAIERELREAEERRRRRQAETALRASEARFRDVFDVAPDGILLVDEVGAIVLANACANRMFGYDDLVGLSVDALVPPPTRASHPDKRASFAGSSKVRRMGASRDIHAQRKDGTRFPVDVALGPTSMNGHAVTVAVVRDVTEQHAMEQRFRQSQKLEAIGSLAGGVAHDFNNLLSIILSYSAMMSAELKPGDPLRADTEEIHAAATRAADLTRQLLAFSRKQILRPAPVNLNDVVKPTQNMLRRLVGEDVEFTFLLAPQLGTTVIDPSQVEQVLMNLVVNARDAMPDGGRVTIETANVDLDAAYAAAHAGVAPGPYVQLAVSDTGTGIDAATQARVFEPFFTTKEVGRGTGLGLSTVFGIVQQSGGHIWLYSEVGEGTTFKIYFPRVDLAARPPTTAPPPTTLRGSETVLLVEDDQALRATIATILRREGYHVLEAQNGGDALLTCEQHGARIHLLLTDVVMPKMSGRQVADRLRSIRPDMKVLYMSGYTDNAIVHHGVLDSDVQFLQKPFTPHVLAQKVREALDAGRTKA